MDARVMPGTSRCGKQGTHNNCSPHKSGGITAAACLKRQLAMHNPMMVLKSTQHYDVMCASKPLAVPATIALLSTQPVGLLAKLPPPLPPPTHPLPVVASPPPPSPLLLAQPLLPHQAGHAFMLLTKPVVQRVCQAHS